MSPLFLMPLRLFFAVASRIVPPLAVRVAERLFTTPPHSRRRDIEHEMLADATRFAIPMDGGPELAGYSWGRPGDPIVLLVHGWTATATCFVNFINPLVDAGFRVVAYDVLAHGNSPGRTVSVTEWADTILAALATVGPVDCIIGHSMGAGGVVIASSIPLATSKIALLSPALDIVTVTEQFADALAIPRRTIAAMRRYAWTKYAASAGKYGRDWDDVFRSDFAVPTLIIHDRDDKEIDIANARRLAERWPWARLIETERLGHRRILLNPDVVAAVRAFILSPELEGRHSGPSVH